MRLIDTGRTATFADGHSERIFETWNESGIFAGCLYEVTEGELTDAERKALRNRETCSLSH